MPDNSSKQQAENVIQKEKLAILARLTATISHDIRNPLGTINTSIFSIKTAIEKKQPERIESALRLAERNIKRCDQILTEFIDVTHKVEINTMPTKIDVWIKGLIEEQAFPPSIEIIHDLNCDHAVAIDPDQLRRALSNIIKNALQALKNSNSAENKLTIHSSMTKDDVVICVSDTGTGIPENVLPRIYEPLFSSKSFGVGLGLTVAREIVEKHDGTISVESETGSGTKVTLKIPHAPAE
ncbi:MAG: ATP-binding protein [Desulfobacteraceae bacterium]|jgi:signal transduction histidine kinase